MHQLQSHPASSNSDGLCDTRDSGASAQTFHHDKRKFKRKSTWFDDPVDGADGECGEHDHRRRKVE